MPAPSQLAIATSSLNRYVNDKSTYHKELSQQETRIAKLEGGEGADDENAEYQLKQEKRALDETKAMFPRLKQDIQDALARLEAQLEQDKGPGDQSSPEEITKAKEAVAAGLKAVRETS